MGCTLEAETWASNLTQYTPVIGDDKKYPFGVTFYLLYWGAHSDPIGYLRQPSRQVTLAEVKFGLFLSKLQLTVYIGNASSSRGARQLGWESCLTSAGRITLASGTTFVHINALAHLPGTALSVASVT